MKGLTTPLFFMLISLLFCPVSAQELPAKFSGVILDERTDQYPLEPYLEYLEDKEGKWSVDDVVSAEISGNFIPNKKEVFNFGYTDSAYWIRFTVENRKSETGFQSEWFLELRYPLLDYVTLFMPLPNGDWMVKKTGDRLPFNYRDIRHHNFVFRIKMSPGEKQTFYFRIKSQGSLEIPLTLWSVTGFAEKVNKKQFASGIYYGLMGAMVLYNLFIFLSVRDPSYLFYVLYITSYTLFQSCLSGEGYEYIWKDYPWWFNHSIPFFIVFTGFWIAQFSKSFLYTKENSPRSDKVLSFFMAGSVMIMLLSLTISYATSIRAATVWILLEMGTVLLTGALCLSRGYRAARYFMIAWFTFLSGTIIYSLKAFGVLPVNFFTSYIMQFGSALLVIMLSLGLADRINTERKEKLLAQQKLLETKEQAAETLEKEVSDRTSELRETLEHVANVNKHILESIRYAEKIQRSLLPSKVAMDRCFNDYFIIEEPRHIVGGDIYLFEDFEDGYLVGVIDCTGHGIPGALMTMLAGSAFKRIVQKGHRNPAQILKSLNSAVKTSLYPEDRPAPSDDGMDAGICFVNTETQTLTYAGAKIPLIYAMADSLHVLKGNRQSIGYKNANTDFDFTNHQIPIQTDMSFYLSTDGIADQTGGPKHFPFGNRRFHALLEDIWKKPFDEQKARIMESYLKWKKNEEQKDDMTVVGFGI